MQSATTLANAVRRAEGELRQPNENEARMIEVRPADIETRTDLFQPRMLTHEGREVDAKYVKKLVKRISNQGELRPVLVVKPKEFGSRCQENLGILRPRDGTLTSATRKCFCH
jgi:hypothetical protein